MSADQESGGSGHQSTNKPKQLDLADEDKSEEQRMFEEVGALCRMIMESENNYDPVADSRYRLNERLRKRKDALLFIQWSPTSRAKCRFVNCDENIQHGDYRIALVAGSSEVGSDADFYHVSCFEKIADFSKSKFLERLQPSSKFKVDAGAGKLIMHWKTSMLDLVARRDETELKPCDPDLQYIFYNAGSASFSPKKPEGWDDVSYSCLLDTFCSKIAPIESDGAGDKEEWNLFKEFSPLKFDNIEDLKRTDSLSTMLGNWQAHKSVVHRSQHEEFKLTESDKKILEGISEKGVRAIKRLSTFV